MALKSSSTGTISGASSLTIAHTVPAGSDRVMIVMASGLNSADPLASATVAYGGVSMGAPVLVPADVAPLQVSGSNHAYAWTLLAPAVGTANVVITCAAGGYVDAIVCTIDGASQAAPAAKVARTSDYEASPATLAIAGTSRQVVDFICNRALGKTMTPAAGQTRIGTAIAGGVSSSTGSYASNVSSMEWTHPDSGTAVISRVMLAFDSVGGPDVTKPTITGSITVGAVTSNSIQISWPAGSDDTGVTSYETSVDGGAFTDRGAGLSYTFTGLSASTSYTLRVRPKDAAGNVADTPLQVTQSTSASADSTPPTMNGSITVGTVASTSIQISWIAASDNVAVTSYETSVNGGAFSDRGAGLSYTFTGLSASTSYTLRVRAKDAAGNVAATPLQVTQSTAAGGSSGTFTSGTLARNNDAAAGASLAWVTFLSMTTGAHVLTKTSVPLTAGVFTVTDAALVAGTEYHATWREAGGQIGWGLAVAS